MLSVCSYLLFGLDLVNLSFTGKQILSFNLAWTFFILCLILLHLNRSPKTSAGRIVTFWEVFYA